MPGIVGFVGPASPEESVAVLRAMVEPMMHESFYAFGNYTNLAHGLCAGWISRVGSFADCMPVWNEARDVCLIFSGETYADQSDIDSLRARGHRFDRDNASYLVHLYEELGARFLESLNGRFSGVLVDLRKSEIVLFNDRYGLGRIYYHDTGERFYFASEAKALLAVLPNCRRLNPASLAEFLSCGCPLQNRSLFQGISLVPGAAAWILRRGQATTRNSYFRPADWENQTPLGASEYYEKLSETFSAVLPRYLRGGERIAVSLTGGVDSRMIMAWSRSPAGDLPCYTFGGQFRDSVDVRIAREVAGICEQPHQVIKVGNDFLAQFPALAERTVYLTDGAMDVSGSADLFVNERAREIAPVRLTGNYGGEILRRIVAFKPKTLADGILDPEFSMLANAAKATYAGEIGGNRLSFVAFKQVPWHHFSRLSLELSQLTLRSPYLDNELVALSFRAPGELATSNAPALRLIADGNPMLGALGTDRGVLHRSIPIASWLRHMHQEFTFKAEYAYDYGMPQWLARVDGLFRTLHFERMFLGRHKFYHFRVWYRDTLAKYVKEVLLDPRSTTRPYVDGSRMRRIVQRHIEGQGNYTLEIHRLLSAELIQRRLIESI